MPVRRRFHNAHSDRLGAVILRLRDVTHTAGERSTVQQGAEKFPVGEMSEPRGVVTPGTEMIRQAGSFSQRNWRTRSLFGEWSPTMMASAIGVTQNFAIGTIRSLFMERGPSSCSPMQAKSMKMAMMPIEGP